MLDTLKEKKTKKQTFAYVHYLKMIAIFAVVGIHVFGDKYYYDLPQNGIWYGVLSIALSFAIAKIVDFCTHLVKNRV